MKTNSGFSLIEILVVMFLIGSFFLFAVPRFQDITEVNIKSASRKLSGIIRYTYNESIFKKNMYRLVFDLDNDEYWVEVLKGTEFVESKNPVMTKKKLPSGTFFRDISTERSFGKVQEGRDIFLLFLPTGFVEYAVIHLETESRRNYTLVTNPYTGITNVYDEYVEFIN